MKALYQGIILAEADNIQTIEGSYYFPIDAVNRRYLQDSPTKTLCSLKGEASYYHLQRLPLRETVEDAAWYYAEPNEAFKQLRYWVAFTRSKGITFTK